jgi:hypothetical protein
VLLQHQHVSAGNNTNPLPVTRPWLSCWWLAAGVPQRDGTGLKCQILHGSTWNSKYTCVASCVCSLVSGTEVVVTLDLLVVFESETPLTMEWNMSTCGWLFEFEVGLAASDIC